METMHQLVPGSGEGQHTGTVDDSHRMDRREAHAMRSPSLLVTISYYSIPAGMLGRGLIHYQRRPADWEQRPLVPRSHCSQQLTPGVRLPPARKGTFLCRCIATLRSVLYALSIHQHRRQGSRAMEAAAPITTYRLTDHAQMEMARRQISASDVARVLATPEQMEMVRPGRVVYQARVACGTPTATYLLRVFVDIDRQPPDVVTVYRSSKITKYWKGTT
jgi:Domain of unknown function (DUF4258)